MGLRTRTGVHLLTWILAACLGVLILGLTPAGGPYAGFVWEFLLALGFCALCLLAWLGWDAESPATQPRLRLHRNLAILAAGLVVVHTAGFLLLDELLVEYLMPTAPAYMLAGIVAFLALLVVTISSLPGPRRKFYRGFAQFRLWHRVLFVIVLAGSLWHTIGTDYTLAHVGQIVIVLAIAGLLPGFAYLRRRRAEPIPQIAQPASEIAADLHASMGGAVIVLLSFSYALAKAALCAAC